ncbi:MAG: hypothetical protein KKD74_04440 [Bacteroidetes bacterium]|nr:hypothetical protein [Bacteroidota bacterium]
MKSVSKILVLLLVVGLTTLGCKKLLDVDFTAEFKADMPMTIAADAVSDSTSADRNTNADWYPFSGYKTIDPADNSDYNKYSDKIKSVTVNSITVTITNLNKSFILADVHIHVLDADNENEASWRFPNVSVSEGTVLTLEDADGKFAVVKAMFEAGHEVDVVVHGKTSENGLTFTITTVFGTKIVANPLN